MSPWCERSSSWSPWKVDAKKWTDGAQEYSKYQNTEFGLMVIWKGRGKKKVKSLIETGKRCGADKKTCLKVISGHLGASNTEGVTSSHTYGYSSKSFNF